MLRLRRSRPLSLGDQLMLELHRSIDTLLLLCLRHSGSLSLGDQLLFELHRSIDTFLLLHRKPALLSLHRGLVGRVFLLDLGHGPREGSLLNSVLVVFRVRDFQFYLRELLFQCGRLTHFGHTTGRLGQLSTKLFDFL